MTLADRLSSGGIQAATGISRQTLAAYLETDYCVFGETPFELHIGVASEPLLELFRQHGTNCAAFITSCNPRSRIVGDAVNASRQAELAKELQRRGLEYVDGAGSHPDGEWPAEFSFLVLGLPLDEAKALGERFEQNAVVWCGADAVPELVVLR